MPHAAFRPSRDDVRATLRLALPMVAVQVGQMAMGVVDAIMVGHVSGDAMAAAALGNLFSFSVLGVAMGVLLALDPLISQAVGARDEEGAARALQRGFVLSAILTLPVALLLVPVERVLRVFGQPESIVPDATGFVHASILGVLPFLLVVAMRQALQARHRIRPIIAAMVLGNVVNAGLNWVLVYGNLGAPAMGAVGSGWSTAITRWFVALCLAALTWSELRPALVPWRRDAFDSAALLAILRLGLPMGAGFLLEMGAFSVAGLVIGRMGADPLAGHQVALNLASFTFMVPLGVGMASSVLVGNAIGRGDTAGARRAAGAGLCCGGAFMTASGVLFVALPGLLASVYSKDAAVIAMATSLIPIAGFFQVFDGVQVVASGILRGAGESRIPAIVDLVGYLLVGLPLGWWLATSRSMGPQGLWWGLCFGLGAVAALLTWRIVHVLRRDVRRVEAAASA